MVFGERIRELREKNGLLQRELAYALQIDTPMFSKIERGERKAKREQVVLLASLLHTSADELTILWLSDQVFELVKNESTAAEILKSVAKQIKRGKWIRPNITNS